MSTVFVTGANGFIGTHLVRALDGSPALPAPMTQQAAGSAAGP